MKKNVKVGLVLAELVLLGVVLFLALRPEESGEWTLTQYACDSGKQATFYSLSKDES